jgi:NAD(P)-dependent dehydrogenase (short-subunit alcohol dehydrogenase family)
MPTYVVTGAASGMGAATRRRLLAAGHQVIGVDRHEADIVADLEHPDGRQEALTGIRASAGDALDGIVTFAGVGPLTGRAGSLLTSVNYFGTVELLEGVRDLLAASAAPAAVAVSSVVTTVHPQVVDGIVDACLGQDEREARRASDEAGSVEAYAASKTAVARWVRHNAATAEWAGAGIRLNAVAPGYIKTPMTAEEEVDPELGPMIAQLPLGVGRYGEPDDIAAFVEFLLGPGGRFFCGSILFADGGTEAILRPDAWPQPLP